MRRKGFWIVVVLLSLNLAAMTLLYAQGSWVTKINDKKISINEFEKVYEAMIRVQAMQSPIPVPESTLKKAINNIDQIRLFLHNYENFDLALTRMRYLKKKNKYQFDEAKIDKMIKSYSLFLKKAILVAQFKRKYIYPSRKVKEDEITKVYQANKKKYDSSGLGKEKLRAMIKKRLKAQKTEKLFQSFMKKARSAAVIKRNERYLNKIGKSYFINRFAN